MACPAKSYAVFKDGRNVFATCKRFTWQRVIVVALLGFISPAMLYAQTGAIYTIDADGTKLKQLARAENFRFNNWPRWSPDGKMVAFEAYNNNNDGHLFVVPAEGGKPVSLGPGRRPMWSPDGKQILFQLTHDTPDGKQGAWIINADGSGRHWMFPGGSPCFSPDGTRILYVKTEDAFQSIFVYDVLAETHEQILHEPYYNINGGAAWSPDGKRVCFTGTLDGNGGDLVIIDAADSNKLLKVRFKAKGFSANITWAQNNLLYLWIRDGAGLPRIHTLDPDTEAAPVRQKNHDHGDLVSAPMLSPDGRKLVFSSNKPL